MAVKTPDTATTARPRRETVAVGGNAHRLRPARLLSAAAVVLMVAASVAGLAVDGLYQDPPSVAAILRAYDLVTLVVAAPLLTATLLPGLRERPRAHLLWVALLAHSAYNYANYVFGTSFNRLFLLHVAVFSASVFALGLALAHLDVARLARLLAARAPVRSISAILLFLGVGLGAMWALSALRFAVSGEAPKESLLVLPAANLHLAYVLDLALLVPAYVLAGALLWRRRPWGCVLAAVLLPFSVVYQVNYMTALVFQARAEVPGATAFDPQEPLIVALVVAGTALLYSNLRPSRTSR